MKLDIGKDWCAEKGNLEDGAEVGAGLLAPSVRPRELAFKEVTHGCFEADAPWDQIKSEASYEVSPLIDGDGNVTAWQANYYTDHRNAHSHRVNKNYDEYSTKDMAIAACQAHSRKRVISIIEEMIE